MTDDKRPRGRPPTGKAMTDAQRQAKRAAAIKQAGGRRLCVVLTAADEANLDTLRTRNPVPSTDQALVREAIRLAAGSTTGS